MRFQQLVQTGGWMRLFARMASVVVIATLPAFAVCADDAVPPKETVTFRLDHCSDADFYLFSGNVPCSSSGGGIIHGTTLFRFRCDLNSGILYHSGDKSGNEEQVCRAEAPGPPFKFNNVRFRTANGLSDNLYDLVVNENNYSLWARSGWMNEVELNGRRWRFCMVEWNPHGQAVNTALFMVTPADWQRPAELEKVFSASMNDFTGNASYALDGAICDFEISKKENYCEVTATVTHPPVGNLLIKGQNVAYLKLADLDKAQSYTVPVFGDRVVVPAGRYSVPLVIVHGKSWYRRSDFAAERNRFVDVSPQSTAALTAGGPLHTEIVLNRFCTTLTCNLELLGPSGEKYYMPNTDVSEGPVLTVRQDGGIVKTASFEYG